MPIKVTGTVSSASVTAHTAIASTVSWNYDEVWLWAYNSQAASVANQANVNLTVQFGDTTTPDHDCVIDIPPQKWRIPVIRGIPLQNGKIVAAYASVANVVNLVWYVNAITDA
jgi:hypothetical protein